LSNRVNLPKKNDKIAVNEIITSSGKTIPYDFSTNAKIVTIGIVSIVALAYGFCDIMFGIMLVF